MFTTQCFIRKNTPELRRKLEKMGWMRSVYAKRDCANLCVGSPIGYISFANDPLNILHWPKPFYDCGVNEALFLALAALRDDSDVGQYFVCDESPATWHYCTPPVGYFLMTNEKTAELVKTNGKWHKATPAELIEHFKNNEK